MLYPAHLEKSDKGDWYIQTVEEHCQSSAHIARSIAPNGLKALCYLAALLHDMGKYTEDFKGYITAAAEGKPVARGSVNHTFTGARFAMEQWHQSPGQTLRNMTAEILAFAVGSHHGQFDCLSPEGADGFLHRIQKEGIGYQEAKRNFLNNCVSLETLDRLFEDAVLEIEAMQKRLSPCSKDAEEMLFYFAMLARMVLSSVIEGDRADTAAFEQHRSAIRGGSDSFSDWATLLARVEAKLLSLPASTAINRARRCISDLCRKAAGRGGIFRLSVPTGGGKTLTALRYALACACKTHKERIFFVIPLLSILEQNAKSIRAYISEDALILEHHSNVIREKEGEYEGELNPAELLLENWRAPIVITTLVQLLNTLFAGKTSCIRRMSALANSVLIIDEVQSVPRSMLSQFNLAINFLAKFCGATVVLCSATQPCLEEVKHGLQYAPEPELVPYDQALWSVFRRTEVKDLRRQGGYTIEELAGFAEECQAANRSVLLICNTKAEARKMFEALRQCSQAPLFHLSTSMCMEHRESTLAHINRALLEKKGLICVSTQLVEAGVDFSFGCVIRVCAGLDNIVQAAGRCNRSGEFAKICPVYIVNIRGEDLSRLPEIRQAQQAAESTLLRYHQNPAIFENDLTGATAIHTYYRDLYCEMAQESQDYPLPALKTSMFQLLSRNREGRNHCPTQDRYLLGQAFRTAGEQFQIFQDDTMDDVIVPYKKGQELITQLNGASAMWDLDYRKGLLREAARFTVSLYEHEYRKLLDTGGIFTICGGEVLALRSEFYAQETGFRIDGVLNPYLEV